MDLRLEAAAFSEMGENTADDEGFLVTAVDDNIQFALDEIRYIACVAKVPILIISDLILIP